jgi:hypothetical protein
MLLNVRDSSAGAAAATHCSLSAAQLDARQRPSKAAAACHALYSAAACWLTFLGCVQAEQALLLLPLLVLLPLSLC